MSKVTKYHDGEFIALAPSDLKRVSVVASALDNQWMPRDLHKKKKTLSTGMTEREKAARSEYLRTLLNSEQVILNRAFLHNNPIVYQDFLPDSPNIESFKRLVGKGVIVPYLFREQNPAETPLYTVQEGYSAWKNIASETMPHCIRFSWEDDTNVDLTRQRLARRFTQFVINMVTMDAESLHHDLGLHDISVNQLKEKLTEVARWGFDEFAAKDKEITREDFYKKFVVADGTSPSEGEYDYAKPLSVELKLLADLRYSLNLPDGLGTLGMTPMDSPPRTVLQEWKEVQQGSTDVDADKLLALIKATTFDIVQKGLGVPGLLKLRLKDIAAVRETEQWSQYITTMGKLVVNPFEFPTLAPQIYKQYDEVAKHIRSLRADIGESELSKWQPVVSLVFEIAGASMALAFPPAGGVGAAMIWGGISSKVIGGTAPILGKMVIRGAAKGDAMIDDLAYETVFLRGRFRNATEQWEMLTRKVSELGFDAARLKSSEAEKQLASMAQPVEEDQYL